MTTPRRPYTFAVAATLALALIVGAFSHGYAQARDGDRATGLIAMVICADGASQTVFLDDTGTPVPAEHCLRELCSACLTHPPLVANGGGAVPALTVAVRMAAFIAPPALLPVPRHPSDPRPRGPPLSM